MRGFTPWPGAYTSFRGQICQLWGRPADSAMASQSEIPGRLEASSEAVYVVCGEGTCLQLETVQIEGRKRVKAGEFVNGARLAPGERFGS
jgi:methionyl-tRNA formyltransferase